MKRLTKLTGSILSLAAALRLSGASEVGYRCEFGPNFEREMKENWQIIGSFLVPVQTKFFFAEEPSASDKRVLVVEAKEASGFFIFKIDGLDLDKYPYMRWRWRVNRQVRPPAANKPEPDDQACAVYLSDGTMLNQKCVGYRWEHFVPVGTRRMINYACSKVAVRCLRNRETPVGEWVEEECNVFEDFKRAFGKEPSKDAVLAIGANSQYSKSDTRVEIDYIECRSSPATGK